MATCNSASELVTAEAIAERYGVTVETVRRWTRNGLIPCLRPSRSTVRYRPDEVDRAIAQMPKGVAR